MEILQEHFLLLLEAGKMRYNILCVKQQQLSSVLLVVEMQHSAYRTADELGKLKTDKNDTDLQLKQHTRSRNRFTFTGGLMSGWAI